MYAGMMELVDMLGLEPSALRCAGSSPVPGKNSGNHSSRVIFCFWEIIKHQSEFDHPYIYPFSVI